MAGSAYFILEGDNSGGLGVDIATAGNFGQAAGGISAFIVSTQNDSTVGAIIYQGVSSSVDPGFPVDASGLTKTTFITGAGEGTGNVVLGGFDFNVDGISDVAISASQANGGDGAVYIIYGGSTLLGTDVEAADLDGTNGVIINGIAGSSFGSSLAFMDGMLFIGGATFGADSDADQGGVVAVSLANISILDGTFTPTAYDISGVAGGDGLGSSIANIGDINDDGFDDLAIGAPGFGAGSNAYVIFGNGTTNPLTGLDLADLDGTNGFNLTGTGLGDVSAAGDVNGDGIADLMVAGADGTVHIVLGADTVFTGTYDLGATGITLTSSVTNMVVKSVGDVSGDGIDDLLIAGVDGSGAGRGYLVFGNGMIADLDLDTLDGTNGFIFEGLDLGTFDAISASGLGDVNGDNINDIAFGAPNADAGLGTNGKVIGFLGGIANLDALDELDGDEDGTIDLATFLDGTPPPSPFIETNLNVTIGGIPTGSIDLRQDETTAQGLISIVDITPGNEDATFNTVLDLPDALPEGTGTFGTIVITDDPDSDVDDWTYTLNAMGGLDALIALGEGETIQDQIILTASNNSLRQITITITGKDDPTVVTLTPALTGLAGMTSDLASISGVIDVSDPDQNDTPTLAGQTITGTYGRIVIDGAGTGYTYFLDTLPTGNPGDVVTETFNATSGLLDFSFDLAIQVRGEDGNDATNGSRYILTDRTMADEGVTVYFGAGNETVIGTDFGDTIDTGRGNDVVEGGTGNDTITDSFGNDTITAGDGSDDVTLLSGNNTITDGGSDTASNYFKGGIGRDTITGGNGSDYIDGDAASSMIGAADRLAGGAGNDYLRGGLGTDVFVFNLGDGDDTIADFDVTVDSGNFVLAGGSLGRDFTVGLDTVELSGFVGLDASNVMESVLTNQQTGYAVLTIGTDTLTFYGVTAAELNPDVFVFV